MSYQINEQEKAVAMATSRNRGAVGAKAVVPQLVEQYLRSVGSTDDRVLDFGCGKDATHANHLKSLGYNVRGYDFHLPHTAGYIFPSGYDVVYASNVLNVQDSMDMLRETLRQMWQCVKPGGVMILNLPTSPRKGAFAGLSNTQGGYEFWLELLELSNRNALPQLIKGSCSNPVYLVRKVG